MGKQAEFLFEETLRHSKTYEVLGANIQIYTSSSLSNPKGKVTLGELDYIVLKQNTQEIIHIELACKFYLYDGTTGISDEGRWIGPNRKDTLFDKLEKLKNKQFPLLYGTETVKKLNDLQIDLPVRQELCLKAFLFIPKKINFHLFPQNFRNCIVGSYMRFKEFINHYYDGLYAIPTKKQWLLPWEEIHDWYHFLEIKEKITQQLLNNRSPLVYRKSMGKVEKFFIVWW